MSASCSTAIPIELLNVPAQNQQVVLLTAKVDQPVADLSLWQFDHGQWHIIYKRIRAMIGRKGLADQGLKKEGDGYTPSGMFLLSGAFGYAASLDTKLQYQQVTNNDFWVDDPSSKQYNQWVKGNPDAKSYETLKRPDDLYNLAIIIDYNINPIIPGRGSAIFMHIWRRYDHPTAGCVAINERHLRRIIQKLDQKQQPVIILKGTDGPTNN